MSEKFELYDESGRVKDPEIAREMADIENPFREAASKKYFNVSKNKLIEKGIGEAEKEGDRLASEQDFKKREQEASRHRFDQIAGEMMDDFKKIGKGEKTSLQEAQDREELYNKAVKDLGYYSFKDFEKDIKNKLDYWLESVAKKFEMDQQINKNIFTKISNLFDGTNKDFANSFRKVYYSPEQIGHLSVDEKIVDAILFYTLKQHEDDKKPNASTVKLSAHNYFDVAMGIIKSNILEKKVNSLEIYSADIENYYKQEI